jgi:hypothetical protein
MSSRGVPVVVAALVAALAGCATPPVVKADRFGAVVEPVRASDAPVTLFADSLPACAFRRVGYVRVEGRDSRDRARLPELLKDAARDLGGDAVIGFGESRFVFGQSGNHPFAPIGNPPLEAAWVGGTPGTPAGAVPPGTGFVVSGTVVRYAQVCPPA